MSNRVSSLVDTFFTFFDGINSLFGWYLIVKKAMEDPTNISECDFSFVDTPQYNASCDFVGK